MHDATNIDETEGQAERRKSLAMRRMNWTWTEIKLQTTEHNNNSVWIKNNSRNYKYNRSKYSNFL